MKQALKKLAGIAVTGILFLLFVSGSALAERTLTAACPSRCGVTVSARKTKSGYVLSLPGIWDLTKISLELEGTGEFLLGEEKQTIRAGEETDLSGLTGRKILLQNTNGKGQE